MELKCPYCNKEIEAPDDEPYDQGDYGQMDCHHCQKRFGFQVEYERTYQDIKQLPCENGEPHDFQDISHPKGYFKTCSYCYYQRRTSKEWAKK